MKGGGGWHPETFIPRREETGESAGIMEVSQGLCEGFTSSYVLLCIKRDYVCKEEKYDLNQNKSIAFLADFLVKC